MKPCAISAIKSGKLTRDDHLARKIWSVTGAQHNHNSANFIFSSTSLTHRGFCHNVTPLPVFFCHLRIGFWSSAPHNSPPFFPLPAKPLRNTSFMAENRKRQQNQIFDYFSTYLVRSLNFMFENYSCRFISVKPSEICQKISALSLFE